MYIYIYITMCNNMCIYIYIYIHIDSIYELHLREERHAVRQGDHQQLGPDELLVQAVNNKTKIMINAS